MKVCSKCHVARPIVQFVRSRNRPDGRHPSCRPCTRRYYEANGERIRSKMREYRERHREEIGLRQKDYQRRRFFWKTASNLRLRSSGNSATMHELAHLWKSQRGLCAITRRRLTKENAQIDHIIPVIKGGSGDISNLRWVHRDVNYAKRDLTDAEFIALCREVLAANT